MRKLLLILMLLVFTGQMSFASDICRSSYDLTSGWERTLSRISGSNFIHKTILEHYLEKQISTYAQGDFDIKIDSFSTSDLKDGKFKSLNAIGENVFFDGVSAAKISLNSLCDFNQLEKTANSTYRFVSDFPAEVTLEFSAEDLNRITNTTDYKKTIKKINQNLMGILRIENVNFEINSGKLWYNFTVSTPFSPKKQQVHLGTGLNIINEDIKISTTDSAGKPTILSILNMTDALNYVNPLDFSVKILENNKIDTDINEIFINNDRIVLKAFVNIRK